MKFKMEFSMDNAAFEEDAAGEIAAILATTARFVTSQGASGRRAIGDSNGNKIGAWEIVED